MTPLTHTLNTISTGTRGIRGPILTFTGNALAHPGMSHIYLPDGLIVISPEGMIEDVGDYGSTVLRYPELKEIDRYGSDELIMPGFVDMHTHYVQTPMVASYGDTLLDWLNRYTFPTEARFADTAYANMVAQMFFKCLLSHGTTTANVFATVSESSVNALFEESERYGCLTISGKVLQDRNVPEAVRDADAAESVELSARLLEKWHGRGRQLYAVIPRFAPTSTSLQLRLAGELYQAFKSRGVYAHTHLNEARSEIEWVRELFPGAGNYTDVYHRFGLVDSRSVFAHCCLMEEEEWQMLHDAGAGVAHCPASNLFLGDGEFRLSEATDPRRPCLTGVGTDIGGGTTFSIPRLLGDAYKVAMLRGSAPDAETTYYMATRGGAEALHLADRIGSIAPGCHADIVVLNLATDEYMARRIEEAAGIFDKLFVLQTIAPDTMCRATYVAGRKVFDRNRREQFAYSTL